MVVAFILTVDPVFDPEIVPFPEIDQRWFTLSDGSGGTGIVVSC